MELLKNIGAGAAMALAFVVAILGGIGVAVVIALAFWALCFAFGYLLGVVIAWLVPSVGVWSVTTLGISFPVVTGAVVLVAQLFRGRAKSE